MEAIDEPATEKICFIIGPIGDKLDPPGSEGRLKYENATQMWENVFEPACAELQLTPIRADKITESGEIPEQIFTLLRDADVVIADLTDGNANVMYELGLRHTRDKVTIQIGEHQRLPFDVASIRTVKFKRTEAGLIDARNGLVEALRTALEGSGQPVSATRVWNEMSELEPAEVEKATAKSLLSDYPEDELRDDEPGLTEMLATGEAATERATEILNEFVEAMEEMGEVSTAYVPQLERDESFASRLTTIRRLADALGPAVTRFDTTSEEYLERVDEIDAMVKVVVELATDNSVVLDEDSWAFLRSIHDLRPSVEDASLAISGALQEVAPLRRLSKQLRPTANSISHSFNRMLRGNEIVSGWASLIQEIPGADESLQGSETSA